MKHDQNIVNTMTNNIHDAHCKYHNELFLSDNGVNSKHFWEYIKTICKDQFEIYSKYECMVHPLKIKLKF